MAGLTTAERAGKAAYAASQGGTPEIEWKDLPREQKDLWIKQAADSGGDAGEDEEQAGESSDHCKDLSREIHRNAHQSGAEPLHLFKHPSIEIAKPVPGRYHITGFQAASVYVPEVGWLAPPAIIDLPLNPDLVQALRVAIADFEKGGLTDG